MTRIINREQEEHKYYVTTIRKVKNKSGETALRSEPNQLLSHSVPGIISGKRLLNDCLYSPVLSFVSLK